MNFTNGWPGSKKFLREAKMESGNSAFNLSS